MSGKRAGRNMLTVDEAFARIRMDADEFIDAFEAAAERVQSRVDRSCVGVRPMAPEERVYRTSGPLFEDDGDGDEEGGDDVPRVRTL